MKVTIVLILTVFLLGVNSQMAQTKSDKTRNDICYKWQTQVDPSFQRIVIDKTTLTIPEIQEGIACLLKLKGKTNKARFSGQTRFNPYRSKEYKPPKKLATVEIAALYYVSYLFYDNWEHANSISLFDADTFNSDTKKIVDRAYTSYQSWFDKVKELGLEKAREQKLDPLEDSGISWK
jgi:hypothetical protein